MLPLSFPGMDGMDGAVKDKQSEPGTLPRRLCPPPSPCIHPHSEARKQFPECWPDTPKALGSVPSIGCVWGSQLSLADGCGAPAR